MAFPSRDRSVKLGFAHDTWLEVTVVSAVFLLLAQLKNGTLPRRRTAFFCHRQRRHAVQPGKIGSANTKDCNRKIAVL